MNQNAAVRTIKATSLEEALKAIKSELGQEAFILSSRRLPKEKAPDGSQLLEFRVATRLPQARQEGQLPAIWPQGVVDPQAYLREFQNEVERAAVMLRSLVLENRLMKNGDLPAVQVQVIRRLVESGVEPGLAEALVRSAPHDASGEKEILRAVADFLMRHLPQAQPLEKCSERTVAMFIGPCGGGKTTTLAKVAAACILAGKKTGIITLDTYRAGALEQLETYAGCLRLGLEVAENSRGLRRAMRRLADRDVVLIDTFGLSLRSGEREKRLRQILEGTQIDEIHLVLGVQTAAEEFNALRRYFAPWQPNRLVFTRLDDTTRHGNLLNGVMTFLRPVSYLSHGPQVPDDLQPASRESLVRLVLSSCRRAAGGEI